MFPEDRVLVGVINRKRDLAIAQAEGWYRIPQRRMPRGVNAEYIAFFLSRAFKAQNGGVYYYAERVITTTSAIRLNEPRSRRLSCPDARA